MVNGTLGTVNKGSVKLMEDLKKIVQMKTIQTKALIRSVRTESPGELLSLKL